MEEDVSSNKHLLIVSWLVHLNERSIEFSLQLIAGNGTYRIFYLLFPIYYSIYYFLDTLFFSMDFGLRSCTRFLFPLKNSFHLFATYRVFYDRSLIEHVKAVKLNE